MLRKISTIIIAATREAFLHKNPKLVTISYYLLNLGLSISQKITLNVNIRSDVAICRELIIYSRLHLRPTTD